MTEVGISVLFMGFHWWKYLLGIQQSHCLGHNVLSVSS